MFRDMRRFKQALTENECIEIFNNNTNGVLALSGDEGYYVINIYTDEGDYVGEFYL